MVTARRGAPLPLAEPDPDERELLCAHQGECLAVAVARRYEGMSCSGCTDYSAITMDEHRQDLEGMAAMYREARSHCSW